MPLTAFVVDLRIHNVQIYLAKLMMYHYAWYNSIVVLVGTKDKDNSQDYDHITARLIEEESDLRQVLYEVNKKHEVEDPSQIDVVSGTFEAVELLKQQQGELKKKLKTNINQLVILNDHEFEFSDKTEESQFLQQLHAIHIEPHYYTTKTRHNLKLPFQVNLLDLFFVKSVRESTSYSGPLYITDQIKFDIKILTKTTRTIGPTLHEVKESVEEADLEVAEKDADQSEQASVNLNEREGPDSYRIAYKYANALVVLDDADAAYLKAKDESPRGVDYLGSIPLEKFDIECCLSHVWIVKGDKKGQICFQAFIQSLLNKSMCAVLRVQTRVNTHQRLGVLRPVYDEGSYYGLLQYIPYQQDVRKFPFPGLPNENNSKHENVWKSAKPSRNTQDAFDKIIKGSLENDVDVSKYHLLSYHYIYYVSLLKYLGRKVDFELPPHLKAEMQPSKTFIQLVENYKDKIPDDDMTEKIYKKKMKMSVKTGIDADLDELLELASLNSVIPDVEITKESFENDFVQALEDEDRVTETIHAMTKFIEKEISEGNEDIADSAITLVRSVCPSENESATFNSWLSELRTKNAEAFEYVKYKKIRPISDQEAKDSDLTQNYCDSFYE
eukprot:NODE_435_length_7481_cov_1.616364.p1 type:complete len:612 gc:universal NODE_435_length_7481_cov_1.616364:3492-1657(-)